jgi:RNA polymerase nonessential primary-like sigma factor
LSLDDTVGKDKTSLVSDFLVDEDEESPEENLLKREGNSLVTEAFEYLSENERVVIRHRFGLDGCPILTLKEIGGKMGVSRERVRQIETQAKLRLRRLFNRPRTARDAARAARATRRSPRSK